MGGTSRAACYLTATVGAVGALLFLHLRHLRRKPTCPECPGWVPLLGHLGYYIVNPEKSLEVYYRASKLVGETFYGWIPLRPYMVVTANPDNVRHILKDNFANYPKGKFFKDKMRDLLGNGIFNSDGDIWKRERKLAIRGMTVNSLQEFIFPIIVEHAHVVSQHLLKASQQNRTVDVFQLMSRFAFETIGYVGFGARIGCLEDGNCPFQCAFDKAQINIEKRLWNPGHKLCKFLGLREERELDECIRRVSMYAHEIIETRRMHLFATKKNSTDKKEEKQLIISSGPLSTDGSESTAVSAQEENDVNANAGGVKFDESSLGRDFLSLYLIQRPDATSRECRDFVMNYLIAGRDTTAHAITWIFYELVQHPSIVQSIREEISVAAAASAADTPSLCDSPLPFDVIRNAMPILSATIFEALRLHPPIPWDPKQAQNDDVLPDGTRITGGTVVMYSAYLMGRSTRIWGDDCEVFDPQRWLRMSHLPSSYSFPVFQAGPRECLGKPLALLEIKTLLCVLLPRMNFSPADIDEFRKISYSQSLTLPMDRPFNVTVESC
eukprot:TRINITY_DN39487_c0_g1_i1.p1 TRINITY_DN39487_c0_g1~~TRINITY_DN39487_c0_g1_i1.p1  ORF type:complete len:552 (+),score=44.09 TRINITY_DN39487_c0_g1_i1:191-1846(+)